MTKKFVKIVSHLSSLDILFILDKEESIANDHIVSIIIYPADWEMNKKKKDIFPDSQRTPGQVLNILSSQTKAEIEHTANDDDYQFSKQLLHSHISTNTFLRAKITRTSYFSRTNCQMDKYIDNEERSA